MTKKEKPKALILEKSEGIRENAKAILAKAGWDVVTEEDSKTALDHIEKSKNEPFTLFICSYKLPKMTGDDILMKVRKDSPFTQRMLLVPADDPDTLIAAINKAKINACIAYPFKDEDLLSSAKECHRQFSQTMKSQQLKRVTVHQNKQMFKIAQNLKKKDASYKKQIDERKLKIDKLKARINESIEEKGLDDSYTLSKLVDQKEIPTKPEAYQTELELLFKHIKTFFDKVALKNTLEPILYDLDDTLSQELEDFEDIAFLENIQRIGLKESLSSVEEISPLLNEEDDDDLFDFEIDETADPLDEFIKLTISEDYVNAHLKKIKPFGEDTKLDIDVLEEYLRKKLVTYGLVKKDELEQWISKATVEDKPFRIAKGDEQFKADNGTI